MSSAPCLAHDWKPLFSVIPSQTYCPDSDTATDQHSLAIPLALSLHEPAVRPFRRSIHIADLHPGTAAAPHHLPFALNFCQLWILTVIAMLDNHSTSSLTSLQDERPERKRHQGWRKPVPQYVPDPPKKSSLLANSSALRRMALLTSGDERPPVSRRACIANVRAHRISQLPANWRENIEKVVGKETLDVERPSSPTPDSVSKLEQASSRGVTKPKPSLASSKSRAEKALPKVRPDCGLDRSAIHAGDQVPSLEANHQSDCGSTLAGSTRSMKLETSERSLAKSVHSSRTRSLSSVCDLHMFVRCITLTIPYRG